VINRSGILER